MSGDGGTAPGSSGAPESLDGLRARISEQQAVIERQAQELERLRRRISNDAVVLDLREAVRLSASATVISQPTSHARLLDMIVATAADIIGANAAALFMIDRERENLVFEVALGEKADEVKKFRVPLGHGVAGLVALTGQPMAVSDTASDDRDAADIAEAVGYTPKNILCVPLFYSDQVIGVLELLDKEGDSHFSPEDMEALGLFANQASVAIELSRGHSRLESLVSGFIESLSGVPDSQRQSLVDRVGRFASSISEDPEYQRSLALAALVQEIASSGDREWEACRGILESFAQFLRARPSTASEMALSGDMGFGSW